jgi:hypothetical protein
LPALAARKAFWRNRPALQYAEVTMCGRYGRQEDKQFLDESFQASDSHHLDASFFAPSWNVAPQSFQPVVRLGSETGERELAVMRWALYLSGRRIPKLPIPPSTPSPKPSPPVPSSAKP